MDELTPPDERERGAGDRREDEPGTGVVREDVYGRGAAADRPATPTDPSAAREDLPFARALAVVGIAILLLSALLLSLPSYLQGGPAVYLIAYGVAILFGPVGFWLLGEAWRIRNRARHGTTLPPGQRRSLRIFGGLLIAIGIFLAFSGFGASGTISTVLNLVWGISLAGYGVRMLLR